MLNSPQDPNNAQPFVRDTSFEASLSSDWGYFIVVENEYAECSQCECGTPVPHRPHELGTPEHDGALSCPLTDEAKVERRLVNFVEPHLGQGVPCQSLDRTKISLSVPHFSQ